MESRSINRIRSSINGRHDEIREATAGIPGPASAPSALFSFRLISSEIIMKVTSVTFAPPFDININTSLSHNVSSESSC